jgi:hypothetical protein
LLRLAGRDRGGVYGALLNFMPVITWLGTIRTVRCAPQGRAPHPRFIVVTVVGESGASAASRMAEEAETTRAAYQGKVDRWNSDMQAELGPPAPASVAPTLAS